MYPLIDAEGLTDWLTEDESDVNDELEKYDDIEFDKVRLLLILGVYVFVMVFRTKLSVDVSVEVPVCEGLIVGVRVCRIVTECVGEALCVFDIAELEV